jgi:hypothetical protein
MIFQINSGVDKHPFWFFFSSCDTDCPLDLVLCLYLIDFKLGVLTFPHRSRDIKYFLTLPILRSNFPSSIFGVFFWPLARECSCIQCDWLAVLSRHFCNPILICICRLRSLGGSSSSRTVVAVKGVKVINESMSTDSTSLIMGLSSSFLIEFCMISSNEVNQSVTVLETFEAILFQYNYKSPRPR